METNGKYFTVGAFVLAGFAALAAVMIWLGVANPTQNYAYYQVYFADSVNGLGKDTTVRYNGIDAGRIAKLQFDADDPKRVIVTLQLDPSLKLRTDSVASIENVGLAGGSYVEIKGGSKSAPLLVAQPGQEYPIIRYRPSTLQQLSETVPALVKRFNVAGDRINDVLNDENREQVAETLKHLTIATEQLNRTLVLVGRTSASINRLSDDTDSVVRNSQAQIIESVGQIHALTSEARKMVGSVTRLSDDLDREPTKVLFGDRREGYTPK
jgi:phospholipid/cholesterol/gamma-HCH transport system substrate-binding protein